MLTQYGNGLKQYDISSNLGLSMEITSEELLKMEKQGLINRKWENDEYTYTIRKT